MSTATYTVTGMTCGHCVGSVTAELTKVEGISDVGVDLTTGTVTVTAEGPVDDVAVREAIDEAGYEVSSPRHLTPAAPQRAAQPLVRQPQPAGGTS